MLLLPFATEIEPAIFEILQMQMGVHHLQFAFATASGNDKYAFYLLFKKNYVYLKIYS